MTTRVRARTIFLAALVSAVVTLTAPLCADAQAPESLPDAAALAAQAQQRKQEFSGYKPAIPSYGDMATVKRMADIGRARGQAEFEEMAKTGGPEGLGGSTAVAAAKPLQASKVPGLVILAISSSMPLQMLRDYMAQLDGVPGAVVLLRGFIGGATYIKPTERWLEQVLRVDPNEMMGRHRRVYVQVDPLVFQSMSISQVPAVTYLPGVTELKHCEGESFTTASVAYGAISISAALQEIKKAGVAIPDSVLALYGGLK